MTLSGMKVKEQTLSDYLRLQCLDNDKLTVVKTKDFAVLSNMDGDVYIYSFEKKETAPKERKPKETRHEPRPLEAAL